VASFFIARLDIVAYASGMADRQVPLVDDPVRWEELHPGMTAPVGVIHEADFRPTVQSHSGQRWHECVRCGHVEKENAMAFVNGKWYCYFSRCAEEVIK
jgi:hypothetical protein